MESEDDFKEPGTTNESLEEEYEPWGTFALSSGLKSVEAGSLSIYVSMPMAVQSKYNFGLGNIFETNNNRCGYSKA